MAQSSGNTKVFAIIVTFNGKKWLNDCMGSLQRSSIPVTTVVVDNASADGSVEAIRENFPEAILISQKENVGFAKANNIGIRYALDHGASHVFLLNQDAWVEDGCLEKLLQTFEENDKTGIASPVHFNAGSDRLDWGFASHMPWEFTSDAFCNSRQKYYSTSFVNAAGWLMSRECIETIGGFDTSLFVHYGEDRNYCERVRFHGFQIIVSTEAAMHHDRDSRIGKEDKYRNQVFPQNDLARRLEYGNISYDIDIDFYIRQTKNSWLKSVLKFNYRKAKHLKNDIEFFSIVKFSRETNKQRGPHWI